MAALTMHVSVRDEKGVMQSFGPGGDVPEWAARQITNPNAWEDGEAPFPAKRFSTDGPKAETPPAAAAISEVPTQDLEDRIVHRVLDGVGQLLRDLVAVEDVDADDSADTQPVPPPKAGKGSGEDKWRAYAAEKNVDLPADIDGRDEIITYLENEGVSVE